MKSTPKAQRSLAAVAVLGAVALTAGACGSSTAGSVSASGAPSSTSGSGGSVDAGLAYAKAQVAKYSGTPTTEAPTSLPAAANLSGKTVWYIPITDAVDSLAGMGAAMTAALAHVGASVHVCDGKGLPTTVSSCMDTAAQQGAAAVVTSYIDYQMVPTSFQALAAKRIPVLVGAEPAPAGVATGPYLQFLSSAAQTDLFSTLMADLTIADSGGKAKVTVIKLADSASTLEASNREIAEFAKYCPGCSVNSVSMQTASISQMPSALSAALVAHPDTNYVTVPTDAYLPPAMGAIRSAGFSAKVKVISADGGLAGLQDVAAGTVAYDPGNPVEWVGWQYANAVIRMLSGQPIPPNPVGPTKVFGPDNVKSLSLTPANYLTLKWYGVSDSAFQQQYLTAWKVH